MQSWYQKVVPLSRDAPARLSFQPGTGYGVAGGEVALPLCLEEIALASAFYPVVFSAGDAPVPLAVTGLRHGQNLFLEDDGSWVAGAYVPAVARNYPFVVLEAQDQALIAIDEAAPQFDAPGGQPLFQDGEPTDLCKSRMALCFAYREGMKTTAAFGHALQAAGLLSPQTAQIALPGGGERLKVEGFLSVDPKKLDALADETFLDWRRKGWLPVLYQHLASAAHWPRLMALAGAHPAAPSPGGPDTGASSPIHGEAGTA